MSVTPSIAASITELQPYTLGPELLTNASMATDTAWTKGTGWFKIGAGGPGFFTFGGASGALSQSVTTEDGAEYKIDVEISVPSSTGMTISFGGVAIISDVVSDGVFSAVVTASGTSNTLEVDDGTAAAQVFNASVKKVNRSVPLGPELLANASMSTDVSWTKGTGWFKTAGNTGYFTFGNASGALSQTVTTEDAAEYRIDVKVVTGTAPGLTVSFGGAEIIAELVGQGVYTTYVTASGVSNALEFDDGTAPVQVVNASIKKVGG